MGRREQVNRPSCLRRFGGQPQPFISATGLFHEIRDENAIRVRKTCPAARFLQVWQQLEIV